MNYCKSSNTPIKEKVSFKEGSKEHKAFRAKCPECGRMVPVNWGARLEAFKLKLHTVPDGDTPAKKAGGKAGAKKAAAKKSDKPPAKKVAVKDVEKAAEKKPAHSHPTTAIPSAVVVKVPRAPGKAKPGAKAGERQQAAAPAKEIKTGKGTMKVGPGGASYEADPKS